MSFPIDHLAFADGDTKRKGVNSPSPKFSGVIPSLTRWYKLGCWENIMKQRGGAIYAHYWIPNIVRNQVDPTPEHYYVIKSINLKSLQGTAQQRPSASLAASFRTVAYAKQQHESFSAHSVILPYRSAAIETLPHGRPLGRDVWANATHIIGIKLRASANSTCRRLVPMLLLGRLQWISTSNKHNGRSPARRIAIQKEPGQLTRISETYSKFSARYARVTECFLCCQVIQSQSLVCLM